MSMVGIITGIYGLAMAVYRIPIGIWSDKINKRKIFFTAAFVINFIATTAMALFPSPGILLMGRMLTGLTASMWGVITVLLVTYFPPEKAIWAISIANIGNNAGQAIGNLIGGSAAEFWGSSAPMFVASGVAIIGFTCTLFIKDKKVPGRSPLKIKDFLDVGKNPVIFKISFLAAMKFMISFSASIMMAPLIAKSMGATSFMIGLLSMVSVIAGVLGSFMVGKGLFNRFQRRYVMTAFLIILAFGCMLYPSVPDVIYLYFIQFVMGFALMVTNNLDMNSIYEASPVEKRASGMGFYQAVYAIGICVGPTISGFMSDNLGLNYTYYAISVFALFTGLLYFIFLKEKPQKNLGEAKANI